MRTKLAPELVGQRTGEQCASGQSKRAASKTGASAGRGGTPHSATSDGAIKPMAAVLKPSSSTMQNTARKMVHWKRRETIRIQKESYVDVATAGMVSTRWLLVEICFSVAGPPRAIFILISQ